MAASLFAWLFNFVELTCLPAALKALILHSFFLFSYVNALNARAWLCARKLCHLFSSFRPFQLISSRRAVPGAVLPRFSPLPLAREDERFVCSSFAVPACAAFSAAAACLSA